MTDCIYQYDDDTDHTQMWYYCTTHDEQSLSDVFDCPAKKRFDAILAKNRIAEAMASYMAHGSISVNNVLFQLKEIEAFIGTANQPTVDDTFTESHNGCKEPTA